MVTHYRSSDETECVLLVLQKQMLRDSLTPLDNCSDRDDRRVEQHILLLCAGDADRADRDDKSQGEGEDVTDVFLDVHILTFLLYCFLLWLFIVYEG